MAIKGIAGETLRTYINYLLPNNEPILGATFTTVVARRPDDTVFDYTLSEIGDGAYEVVVPTIPTDPAGEWLLVVEAELDGTRFEEVFDIQAVHVPQFVPQPAQQSGASRAELRRAIAASLGDLTQVTATENKEQGTIVDNVNLAQPLNAFNGMQIICTYSAWPQNIGHIATVMSNNPADRNINIEPPLPQISMQGDTFELYNYRGNGWRVDQYNGAINQAITRAGDEHSPLPYDVTIAHDGEYLTIPPEFSHFSGVYATDRSGNRKKVPPANVHVERSTRELSLSGRYSYKGGQYRTLRIVGSRRPDQLLTDDARTHIPFDWIVFEASAILLGNDVSMGITQGERDRMLAMQRQGADGRRSMVIRSFPPGTIKLPS